MDFGLALAFSSGFIGGFGHCIGMCGPFVAAYTMHRSDTNHTIALIAHLLFNSGRITTYTFIGALMGLSGSFVNTAGSLAGLQNAASLIAGVFMCLMGLSIMGIFRRLLSFERYNSFIVKPMKVVLSEQSIARFIPFGMLVGLLPCGLSYSIFIASAGSGSMLKGLLLSLVFGIGTSFSLILFGYFFNLISLKIRGLIYRLSGLTVFVLGVYFIYRAIQHHA